MEKQQTEKKKEIIPQEQIKELGGALAENQSNSRIYTLTIIGQIEGHQILPETAKTTKYEHVMPLLATIEESPEIDGLLLLLNTVGGDVEAGLAIAELIAAWNARDSANYLAAREKTKDTLQRIHMLQGVHWQGIL